MSAVVLEPPARNWECPACGRAMVTRDNNLQPRLHPCKGKGMNGLMVPFVEVTGLELDRSKVRVHRDDYVGNEIVRTDKNGRPAMAVVTERADGSNDCHAFAGCAQGKFSIG